MHGFRYLTVTVNHGAQQVNFSDGGPPRDVPNGYFDLLGVFNSLGAQGWELTSSVHEEVGTVRYTLHFFRRVAPLD